MTTPALNLVRRPETRPVPPKTWIDCRLQTPTVDDLPVLVYARDREPDGVPPRRILIAYALDSFRPNPRSAFEMLYWMPAKGVLPTEPGN